jgi:TPP-dependent pyruvate/acetoin dehydrogenase alpha subunit
MDQRVEWFDRMLTIRVFEETVQELYARGLVSGTVHLCQGQEAVCVGVASALGASDYLTITYRAHGAALAKGVSIEAAIAELMGRSTGVCRGLGGSMHLMDYSQGLIGAFGIVGAGIPVALGAAMSAKLRGEPLVAVAMFGDGAANIGTFHETLNMAAVWKAPVVFVCENNLYAEYSPVRSTTALEDIAARACAYGMPGEIVDGMDVEKVHETMRAAVERARAGSGPTLVECKTYRYCGHSRTDPGKYRPLGELEAWKARDPIDKLGRALAADGLLNAEAQDELRRAIQQRIDDAVVRATKDPFPTLEDLYANVYAD